MNGEKEEQKKKEKCRKRTVLLLTKGNAFLNDRNLRLIKIKRED